MDALGDGAGLLEGELGLVVAVGAGGPQDQDAWRGHDGLPGSEPDFCLTRPAAPSIMLVCSSADAPIASAAAGIRPRGLSSSSTGRWVAAGSFFPFFSEQPLTARPISSLYLLLS